jgi:hypothetical protein
VLFE